MKIDTTEKKIIYFMGYLQALAETHAREFDRDIQKVKNELLEMLSSKQGGAK